MQSWFASLDKFTKINMAFALAVMLGMKVSSGKTKRDLHDASNLKNLGVTHWTYPDR